MTDSFEFPAVRRHLTTAEHLRTNWVRCEQRPDKEKPGPGKEKRGKDEPSREPPAARATAAGTRRAAAAPGVTVRWS